MAKLGIVPDDQFESELARSDSPQSKPNVVVPDVVIDVEIVDSSNQEVSKGRDDINKSDTKGRGRAPGDVNVPDSLRALIASESHLFGRQAALELASDMGISPSSVSAYTAGHNSTKDINTGKPKNSRILDYIANRKVRLTKKALHKLSQSLDCIDPDKLAGVKQRDIAAIAKDMSMIARNLEPETKGNQDGKPQFVIYAPTIKQENNYDSVHVSE